MIKFFRKIRQRLLTENKFSKYLIYAFGEIVLIIIGIFFALQLQNWNETRKQKAQFKNTLEQLYTTIKYDTEIFSGHSKTFENDIESVEELLNNGDSIPDKDLPLKLFLLSYGNDKFFSESTLYAKDLIAHPENRIQKDLTKEVLNYLNNISNDDYFNDDRLTESLENIDLAYPSLEPSMELLDSTYYTSIDFTYCRNLLKTRKFKSILKTVRAVKKYNYAKAINHHNDGLSIMELIKDYYPEVKVIYKYVGIIGTAINGYDDVGAKSTPMTLRDADKGIWEIKMYLKKGTVKFRCRDSWSQNWGLAMNAEFPKGSAGLDGGNISIPEEGNYKVILDLTDNTFEFIKQDE